MWPFLPVRFYCIGALTGKVALYLVLSQMVKPSVHHIVTLPLLPVRSSRCTGVPTGRVILCLVTSWKVGSGIHSVVAVRKDRSVGVAGNNKHAC